MINKLPISQDQFMGVRTQGNPAVFKGTAIVGFIDLLGFSASVRANWNDAKNSPLNKLLRIKELADKTRETTIAIATDAQHAPPAVSQAFRSRIHTVSDSLVVCSALPSKLIEFELSYQLSALTLTINFIWEHAVEEGYTIRGGIELGPIYWTPAETIGPALVDAYSLEYQHAKWSRVVIGPALLRHIAIASNPPVAIRDLLTVSEDGLIELRAARLMGQLQKLEALSAAAGSASTKYRPLLAILRGERQIRPPTNLELTSAATALSGIS
jgi:hypothetical protein